MDFTRTRIAGYKMPKSIDFVDALPRNATGKVLKRELRKPFWEGRERQVNLAVPVRQRCQRPATCKRCFIGSWHCLSWPRTAGISKELAKAVPPTIAPLNV